MLRRLWAALRRRVSGKELVGTDKNGNRYYRWVEKASANTGRTVEKREVDFAVKGEYDPLSMPPEWVAWLHKFRRDAPTAEESKKIEEEKARRAARVAALELEEEKRKYRLRTLQAEGMPADAQPNMQRYVEQLTKLGYGQEGPDDKGRAPEPQEGEKQ